MAKKRITFYLDSDIHDEFKNLCDKNAVVMSKKVQMLIEKSLKEEK